MKREILFRGKSIETGEWVYGNYLEKIKPTEINPVFWACFIHDRALTLTEVDPETIGQFTGLIDKNGNKVFDGDIIRFKTTRYRSERQKYQQKPKAKWFKSPVLFSKGEFLINEKTKISMDADDYDTPLVCCFDVKKGADFEPQIIGNIFDNPDFIEVAN